MQAQINAQSKYLKPQREGKMFYIASCVFFFCMFVLPQYFGVPLPVFDFTVLRIMVVIVFLMIAADNGRWNDFSGIVMKASYTRVLIPYLLVLGYTMVLRVDINAFLNPFLELFGLYLLIYIIKYEWGYKKCIKILLTLIYIIAILGLIEIVMSRSPFSYLETITGLYTGRFVRSGHYRIMGPSNHSLGFGLMLVTMVPIACLDLEKNEINVLKRFPLLIMLTVNIFMTGSRSTLSVFFLEILLLVLFMPKMQMKRLLLIGAVLMVVLVMYLVVFHNTSSGQYILLQITSIVDELLGTELSLQFGADASALGSSSNYRDQLKQIFTIDWLNPLLGIGRKRSFSAEINGSYVISIDNFYIAEYVRYAYPGMLTYLIFLVYCGVKIARRAFREKSAICKALLAGAVCYCINLLWVDSLQTLKYLYILFAIYAALPEETKVIEVKKQSKYLKR